LASDLYPAGFLNETRRTFRLFFPTEAVKDAKRTRKIEKCYHVDLEAQIALQERLQLKEYPYFGERLSVIQHEYNAARPTRIRQWWFDRRNRVEWVCFGQFEQERAGSARGAATSNAIRYNINDASQYQHLGG
jgi:hypothetical protein